MKYYFGLILSLLSLCSFAEHMDVYDKSRDRHIPILISYPDDVAACKPNHLCPVAFISAGNRVPYEEYKFITKELTTKNYLVVAINHEIPSDPPLSRSGDLYKTRIENWKRGSKTIDYIHNYLSSLLLNYDFDHINLIGHSNGGDISVWAVKENSSYVKQLITLDHKRVALPKNKKLRILSIRSPEYPTKEGVTLSKREQKEFDVCIVEIPNSKHMDLTDYGISSVKRQAKNMIVSFFIRIFM